MKISKILIGIDYSEYSRNAAEYGFDLARTHEATVGLVHVIEAPIIPSDSSDTFTGISVEGNLMLQDLEMEKITATQSETILDRVESELANGIDVIKYTEYGGTANSILECGNVFGADLIIVGTHKRSGLDRLLMGSVAEHVVRNSTVPVLVVPFEEE